MTRTAATSVDIHPLLKHRWSPRSFDVAHEVDEITLAAVLEAARWSSSASNAQPWRFVVARRGDVAYESVFAALKPGNQLWAGHASALIVAVAEEVGEDGSARPWAAYDLGQAVAQLVVQAHAEGLHAHQMAGFEPRQLIDSLAIPTGYRPVVVVALGTLADAEGLPEQLRQRELAPRRRRALDEIAFGGAWGAPVFQRPA